MKSLFLSLVLILCIQTYNYSQTNYKVMYGSNLHYETSKMSISNYEQKLFDFSFSQKIGFFLDANSLIGLEMGISYIKQIDYDDYGYYEVTQFALSAFYRYQNQIVNNFNYFIEPNLGRIFTKDSEMIYYNIGIDFGFLYSITSKLSFEMKLLGFDYNTGWYKDNDFKTQEFSIEYDLIQPNLGIKYYF